MTAQKTVDSDDVAKGGNRALRRLLIQNLGLDQPVPLKSHDANIEVLTWIS
jgi:hypothetical protein